ncbi:mitochondrial proton/calcium exchanger protein-like protein isoform X1 [Tanacetum coccineum]
MQEVILFYNGLGIPTRQILDSRGAIPSKTAADAKVAIQEMAEYSPKWHNETSRSRSTETSNGLAAIQSQLNNLGREIKKVNEKVYAAQVGCEQCKGPHYTKDFPLKEEGKTRERSLLRAIWQSMEDTLSKFMSESAKRHKENSNLIKEIRASTDAAIRNQGASIKTLEIQIGQISKSISTTIEADSYPIHRIGSSQYVVSTGQSRTLMYKTRKTTILFPSRLNGYCYEEKNGSYGPQFSKAYSKASQSIPQKQKDPRSFTLPCFINNVYFDNALVDLGASVSVMPLSTYLNLGLGELVHTKLTVELADRTVKYPKGIAENVLVDPLNGDYTELNDLNEPFELRRNQGDDLMPTIEEGEVIEEFRTRDDELDTRIDDYPSCCDYDKKIHIDLLTT